MKFNHINVNLKSISEKENDPLDVREVSGENGLLDIRVIQKKNNLNIIVAV